MSWRLRSLALGLALGSATMRAPYPVISRRRWAIEHPVGEAPPGVHQTESVTLLEGLQAA